MVGKTGLVVVSNRLPVALKKREGEWEVTAGSGGLVTAMAPVLRNRGGTWIGWSGVAVSKGQAATAQSTNMSGDSTSGMEAAAKGVSADGQVPYEVSSDALSTGGEPVDGLSSGSLSPQELTPDELATAKALEDFSTTAGYDLRQVPLSEEDVSEFYYGFANEVIWPLFHDFQSLCNFDPRYWHAYRRVNHAFADAVLRYSRPEEYVWVHDYHLMHVAREMRTHAADRKIGFFLHIPFPHVDNFVKIPWRAELLEALLEYDLVGFQTYRDRRNFMQCVSVLLPEARPQGRGPVLSLVYKGRTVRVGAFPISIDYKSFVKTARSPEVDRDALAFRDALRHRKIILGVDRLDYTKGIPYRLKAFRRALERYPELHEKVSLVQVVVPSREEIPKYASLKREVERLVGEINGQFTRPGWVPIHYQYRSLGREELVAYYKAASMALVTPLRDGMNLVAKEFCACNVQRDGVLFLSEFAGAAAQLKGGAMLVNPFDEEGVADAIYRAVYMDREERRLRMGRMREGIRKNDIFRWVDSFLTAAFSRHLWDFPPQGE